MASAPAPSVSLPQWRVAVFRLLAAILGLVYLPGVLLMAAPWAPASLAGALPTVSPLIWAWARLAHPDIGRWTFALSASVDEAIALILFALAWRPLAGPLLMQFTALALVVDLAANVPFVPGIIVGYSPLLLLVVAYPRPRRLVLPFWRERPDWPLLVAALAIGAFLLPSIWQALSAQVRGADELALSNGWASTVEHLCNLWLMALLAAFRQPGSSLLALLVAACLLYLGLAAIAVPGNPGSWGVGGGAIAVLGGVAYAVVATRSLRREPPAGK